MPTITDIKPQKKSQQLYNIYVDDKFALGISDLQISLLGLKIGQTITDEKLQELCQDVQQQKAYNKSLFYLKFRPRSEKELRDYLFRKGFEEPSIESSLDKLKSEKLIDDGVFCRQWIANRLQLSHYPLIKIRYELRQKGINKEILDHVFSEMGDNVEEESLRQLMEQKMRLTKYNEPQKLLAYIVGKGYPYRLTKQVIAEELSRKSRYLDEYPDDDQPKNP